MAPAVPRAAPVGVALASLVLLLSSCAAPQRTGTPAPPVAAPSLAQPEATAGPFGAGIEPAPGSSSRVYAPNPGSIVVALDAGHGGCLDWGVPDPSERGPQMAEKTLTLQIAHRARALLEEQGIRVLMIRDADEALAGDHHPELGCEGPTWRDVNGDGVAGFGSDLPEATRTRDELQARLDLANLAQADVLLSIHINSPTDGRQRIEVAFSETFYTDETAWGAATARLADLVQGGVVSRLESVAAYERGDRGTTAHNFFLVAPPLLEPTAERPNPAAQPTRGGLMPVVLTEAGSITLRAEHDLLAAPDGQDAVAAGIVDGLAEYFGTRPLSGRVAVADAEPGVRPRAVPGDGPPFWAPVMPDDGVAVRLTNTGSQPWPAGARLVAGWQPTDEPYLASAPAELVEIGDRLPALAAGESVTSSLDLPRPPAGRSVAWITLRLGATTLADAGVPALQLASEGP